MLPFVDTHCHLLAGLDDGPATWAESLAMCRLAWSDGTRAIAATAHQNEDWPDVAPETIIRATRELERRLDQARLPLAVYPCAEVTVGPDLVAAWDDGRLLGMNSGVQYLLLESPRDLWVDLRELIAELFQRGVRPILAHPERQPELLHEAGVIEDLIGRGCLIQVSADSLAPDQASEFVYAIRQWIRRDVVHLVGSDAHGVDRRPPGIAAAFETICTWAGPAVAERLCSLNGMCVLEGLALQVPRPRAAKRRWFSRR
jgi:protein-tyrosine phosphatase